MKISFFEDSERADRREVVCNKIITQLTFPQRFGVTLQIDGKEALTQKEEKEIRVAHLRYFSLFLIDKMMNFRLPTSGCHFQTAYREKVDEDNQKKENTQLLQKEVQV